MLSLDKNSSPSPTSHFLKEVTEQISYKPLRPSIRQELESHIQDRMEDYESQGLSPKEAEAQALRCMGDAAAIGTRLNEVHKLQKAPLLTAATALLLLTGLAFAIFMQWRPVQIGNRFIYYIMGVALLILVALHGYPLLIRYRKILVLSVCPLYLAARAGIFLLSEYHGYVIGNSTIAYCAILLSAPVITVILYCSRLHKRQFLITASLCAGIWMLLVYTSCLQLYDTVPIMSLLSMLATLCYMARNSVFSGKRHAPCIGFLAGLVLIGSPVLLTGTGRNNAAAFLSPQSAVHSTWDDTYNGILIQELLSKTPLTHGLELSAEKMMEYGSGAWYFESRDFRQVGLDITGTRTVRRQLELHEVSNALWEQGYMPRYLQYHAGNVTLWDILPIHYHNNYIIAVAILLFGWIPGLFLVGGIGLFYLILFSCIGRIRGLLASSLGFCCSQCLLWQGVFYVLGNFGYQYGQFPNMPLLSEGRLSIMLNLLLLGLIFSAYRFDHVTEEPVNYTPVPSP